MSTQGAAAAAADDDCSALLPPHIRVAVAPTTYVVALYYHYIALGADAVATLRADIEATCRGWHLAGRVRVSPEGLNGTVGGDWDAVALHVRWLRHTPLLRGTGPSLHFKFGLSCADRCVDAQRLRGLSVKVAKEVVTLHPADFDEGNVRSTINEAAGDGAAARVRLPGECGAARHVTPELWHSMLRDAAAATNAPPIVLLDTRNSYETAIGHFDAPGVHRVDPNTRQFSDFPQFVAAHRDLFRGKRVMMYCTGGVRCERASQLLTASDVGAADVVQLENGIHAYLDAFPLGGFFAGRNFVFDERLSVLPPGLAAPLRPRGCCVACGAAHDDYTNGARCHHCRMRILVCGSCLASQGAFKAASSFTCAGCAVAAASVPAEAEVKRMRKEAHLPAPS